METSFPGHLIAMTNDESVYCEEIIDLIPADSEAD